MKKITALILAIILCFTLAIPALGSEMSVNGQAYSINGIDVYKYPLKASQYFSVENFDCGYTGGYRVVTEIDWS